jgi:hypothetical protein
MIGKHIGQLIFLFLFCVLYVNTIHAGIHGNIIEAGLYFTGTVFMGFMFLILGGSK